MAMQMEQMVLIHPMVAEDLQRTVQLVELQELVVEDFLDYLDRQLSMR